MKLGRLAVSALARCPARISTGEDVGTNPNKRWERDEPEPLPLTMQNAKPGFQPTDSAPDAIKVIVEHRFV